MSFGFNSEINSDFQFSERYPNPFYGIPLQHMPNNIDGMLQWADHFLLRFGFYRAVLQQVSCYFITSLLIEAEDSDLKEKYKAAFEELNWKIFLAECGVNLIAYGNLYLSIQQGFQRYIICPKCGKVTNLEKITNYTFLDGKISYECPSCGFKGQHEIVDKPVKNTKKISKIFWNPKEVLVRYEPTTANCEYYWNIPQTYQKKIFEANNKFFSKYTPKVIFDTVKDKKMLLFNNDNFLHIKYPTPAALMTDGRAVPPCMYLFDDFFMLKVLERYNEVITFEDIAPFRVISMAAGENSAANPILNQNSNLWTSAVDAMIEEHRKDPGSYHKFPFPVNYQQLGGQGKALVPTELMQNIIVNILNAMNVPRELYTMNLQTQAVGPSLRLFENTWSFLIYAYNDVLQHTANVIGKIKGYPLVKIRLVPITLADDMERKGIISQLVSANAIAKSELLDIYNFDYTEQLRKKMEEERIGREIAEEEEKQRMLIEQNKKNLFNQDSQQLGGVQFSTNPNDVLAQAQEIAAQLFPLDGAQRRQQLQQIKATDLTLYGAVKTSLDELTAQAKSQGVAAQQRQMGG